ncbi:MAG TPA: ATP-binding protein, partial [Chitinophagaceae bacterium]|nr:ATP-binding protein [Chitinophagaceae bacterium]
IVYSNSQFGKMVGLPLSKITGVYFNSLVSPNDEDTYEALIAKGWKEDTKGELTLASSSKVIPVQLSITTLELDEGTSLSIILTDLTAQKQTQLLLKVNNEKLQQINHELELSNHDLHQFASVASHDLQEPLRKIQIFSNFLKERFATDLTQEASGYLEKIISSSQRMKALIIDILNYSQLSQDDNSYVLTDLNVLLNEVLEDYEILIKEKKATITIGDLPSIEVNPGQMRQVFQNIISNALKFIRHEVPPDIRISCKPVLTENEVERKEESFCYLSFKDNGIGFDDQFAKKIFTLFRRLHTKDKFEGTGIGLAISKKIIEKHHGNIIAKGQEGNGSEFIIVLPTRQNRF